MWWYLVRAPHDLGLLVLYFYSMNGGIRWSYIIIKSITNLTPFFVLTERKSLFMTNEMVKSSLTLNKWARGDRGTRYQKSQFVAQHFYTFSGKTYCNMLLALWSKNEILKHIEKPHQLFSQDNSYVSMCPVYRAKWNGYGAHWNYILVIEGLLPTPKPFFSFLL